MKEDSLFLQKLLEEARKEIDLREGLKQISFRQCISHWYALNCFSKHKGSIQQVPVMRLEEKAIYLKIRKTP